MFFFFSKILEFFIQPLSWILILAALGLIVKRKTLKKKLLIAAGIVLIVFTDPFLLNQFGRMWDIKPAPLPQNTHYSCAIVLGGFSSADARGNAYFNWSADRFIQAVKLYNTGKVSRILVSGGSGTLIGADFREADWVKTQLKQFNVPDSCILAEDKSRNTIENAAFTKNKLDSAKLSGPYVLITSSFHMRRSLQIFKKTHVDVVPFACNNITAEGFQNIDDFIPDAATMGGWNIYIKEFVGYVVNLLR